MFIRPPQTHPTIPGWSSDWFFHLGFMPPSQWQWLNQMGQTSLLSLRTFKPLPVNHWWPSAPHTLAGELRQELAISWLAQAVSWVETGVNTQRQHQNRYRYSRRMCCYSLVEELSKGLDPLHEPHKLFHFNSLLGLDFLYINFKRVLTKCRLWKKKFQLSALLVLDFTPVSVDIDARRCQKCISVLI